MKSTSYMQYTERVWSSHSHTHTPHRRHTLNSRKYNGHNGNSHQQPNKRVATTTIAHEKIVSVGRPVPKHNNKYGDIEREWSIVSDDFNDETLHTNFKIISDLNLVDRQSFKRRVPKTLKCAAQFFLFLKLFYGACSYQSQVIFFY